MQTVIEFVSGNWESISAVILWIAVRLIPTKKNLDVVQLLLQTIGKIIPNRKADSLNQNATH